MSVEANIVVREAAGVLLVPAEAVNAKAVQVIENGTPVRRTVTTGIAGTGRVEITGGLADGDLVLSPFRADIAARKRVRVDMVGATAP
jgi:multidrug efflux pump subunit AcrA (membrane-fusion protein)